jgi:hypothetical protein
MPGRPKPSSPPIRKRPKQRDLLGTKQQQQSRHVAELRADLRYAAQVRSLSRKLKRALRQADNETVALWAWLDRSAAVEVEKASRAKLELSTESIVDARSGEELELESAGAQP